MRFSFASPPIKPSILTIVQISAFRDMLGVNDMIQTHCLERSLPCFLVLCTVRLIETETERVVWTERYQRLMADVFDVQLEIAERVSPLGLGADVITGFPGETEEAFQRTLDLMEEVKFDNVSLVFPIPLFKATP